MITAGNIATACALLALREHELNCVVFKHQGLSQRATPKIMLLLAAYQANRQRALRRVARAALLNAEIRRARGKHERLGREIEALLVEYEQTGRADLASRISELESRRARAVEAGRKAAARLEQEAAAQYGFGNQPDNEQDSWYPERSRTETDEPNGDDGDDD